MLLCSVSLRPRGHVIAASIVEPGAALDSLSLSAIFATLTDDPGNALDILTAFVGQNMVEAASAAAVVSAGSVYAVGVIESAAAISVQGATVGGGSRDGMIGTVMVHSDGTARQANADGTFVNL